MAKKPAHTTTDPVVEVAQNTAPSDTPVAAPDLPSGNSDPIKIAEPEVSITAQRNAAFFKQLVEARRLDREKPEPVPTPMTPRQLSQTEIEMEAGRKAGAKHAERAVVQRPKEKSEGTNTRVFAPEEYTHEAVVDKVKQVH